MGQQQKKGRKKPTKQNFVKPQIDKTNQDFKKMCLFL